MKGAKDYHLEITQELFETEFSPMQRAYFHKCELVEKKECKDSSLKSITLLTVDEYNSILKKDKDK